MNVFSRNLKRLAEDSGGAAAVEFALAGTVLVMFIVGIMDISNAMRVYETLQTSAKEGARYAAIHGEQALNPETDLEIIAYTRTWAVGLDPAKVTVQVVWNTKNVDLTDNKRAGQTVTVSSTMTPYEGIGLLPSFNLGAASTFTITR